MFGIVVFVELLEFDALEEEVEDFDELVEAVLEEVAINDCLGVCMRYTPACAKQTESV